MNIDVVDVRLDERKLPYLVSETVAEYRGEYVGEQRLKVNSPEKVVKVLNNVFHMKDFSEEKLYERTGIQKQIFNTVYQLKAVKKQNPDALEQEQT